MSVCNIEPFFIHRSVKGNVFTIHIYIKLDTRLGGKAASLYKITYKCMILHFWVWGVHVHRQQPYPAAIGHSGSQLAGPGGLDVHEDPPIIPERGRTAVC